MNNQPTKMNQTKITNLSDKLELRILRDRIEAVLAPWASEIGVVVTTGTIKYEADGSACSVQVKCAVPDANGKIVPEHEKDFKRYWSFFTSDGLKAEHLHAIVYWNNAHYKIIGLRPKARRFPLLATRSSDGKKFCLPISAVTKGGQP
jgi:hypothetical protein